MSIIPKILQKINPSYQNYQPLIEHDIPVLFTIKNPRNQGVSRFQSGEELVNSVGK